MAKATRKAARSKEAVLAGPGESNLRHVYAQKALTQVPRLLGNQDRNPYSPTYGCFHRDYWLDKTSDFPDAVRQFGVHALALVYRHDFPGNIYKGQPKIRDWAVAGLDFWASIQHEDGSFDEFYPFERGWVGPTAFTAFAATEAYTLLGPEIPQDVAARVREAIVRAARFIAAGESEEDHLANHHAMACLAVWKAYEAFGDPDLKRGFDGLWRGFLAYHNAREGWSREYDGVDPGYLSATVSFLAKIYRTKQDPEILEVLKQSVECCSYFAYPNGFYAGSAGSRNTLHFYPHGFEILAGTAPLAASVADAMLKGLSEGKLVAPEIMSDRYVFYRVPEYLQAYLDYTERPSAPAPLPYEQAPFTRYFSDARVWVSNTDRHYIVSNLAKGGVVKVFGRADGRLLLSDCGIIGNLEDGRLVTSQWIDPGFACSVTEDGWEVEGRLQVVPSTKLFTPLKHVIFRCALILLGRIPELAHQLKGKIRKALILGQRAAPVRFRRRFTLEGQVIRVVDELHLEPGVSFRSLSFGDEFFVRYVPQSRYFQSQELDVSGFVADRDTIDGLNRSRYVRLTTILENGRIERR